MPVHGPPAGTFVPGTKVQVGSHRVVIEKYLSEGGFAHVYVVRLPKPVDGVELAVLKRVAVPDKEHLANMRTEVETMKKLRGHRYIVKYMDSHASQLKGGGYEVFLLMEYCSGGGLIDFMNTRLQNRLTEPEILKIFSDVAEGVACMHYLRPPLLHRDLKVENVLISNTGSFRTYKLCDFGSAANPRPAATSAAEGRLIEDDVQRHTTLQYRSPEMIDVYRKHPIDEKSDIWALGVLLYKLCYYTTPFEEVGQMAILNAHFKYPAYPYFSDQLKMLIATMLKEDPAKRPNIYQVLQQACKLQGKEVSIRDIYAGRSQSESRDKAQLPSSRVGATLGAPKPEPHPGLPDVAPMRRGRPTKPVSHHGSAKPSPSPLRMINHDDPFASLDGGKITSGDEISARFPTLDQFSLLTDNGKKFGSESSAVESKSEDEELKLSRRVTNALADEAFMKSPSPERIHSSKPAASSSLPTLSLLEKKQSKDEKTEPPRSEIVSPIPQKPSTSPTSTMASSSSPPPPFPSSSSVCPIHRFPNKDSVQRPASQPWSTEKSRPLSTQNGTGSRLSSLLNRDAANSQLAGQREHKSPASSRPSLEGSRPSAMELDNSLSRSRSFNSRARPVSMNVTSKLDRREQKVQRASLSASVGPDMLFRAEPSSIQSDMNIRSDVDFLKAKEEEERSWKKEKRLSSGSRHGKRASLPSIALSGTKNLLAGRFGDAFRKFEGSHSTAGQRSQSPSPSRQPDNALTPIAGSVATDLSDDRHEIEDVSPEVRRELEKRRLDAEERRVELAGAEYKKRVYTQREGGRDNMNAVSIQEKVQSHLKENEKPATKTAARYGLFTDLNDAPQVKQSEAAAALAPNQISTTTQQSIPSETTRYPVRQPASEPVSAVTSPPPDVQVLSTIAPPRLIERPMAPPKPQVLRTGIGNPVQPQPVMNMTAKGETWSPNEDWEAQFSKRYPSLTALEMVETEIDTPRNMPLRTKEV